MVEFNKEMKDFASREINSKIYYRSTTEEALKLIDRKKYNKIILITNGGNKGEEFIKKAREIIGGKTIVLVTCYLPSNHLEWVSKLPNTLLSNDKEIFEKLLLNAVKEDLEEMKKLKEEIEEKYEYKFDNFIVDKELFNFKHFMDEGELEDLTFDPKYNLYNYLQSEKE